MIMTIIIAIEKKGHLFWSRWGRYRVTSSGCTMSSQPKLCMMAWTGWGCRSWGAEVGRSKANRVKPGEGEGEEEEEDKGAPTLVDVFLWSHILCIPEATLITMTTSIFLLCFFSSIQSKPSSKGEPAFVLSSLF